VEGSRAQRAEALRRKSFKVTEDRGGRVRDRGIDARSGQRELQQLHVDSGGGAFASWEIALTLALADASVSCFPGRGGSKALLIAERHHFDSLCLRRNLANLQNPNLLGTFARAQLGAGGNEAYGRRGERNGIDIHNPRRCCRYTRPATSQSEQE